MGSKFLVVLIWWFIDDVFLSLSVIIVTSYYDFIHFILQVNSTCRFYILRTLDMISSSHALFI